LQRWERESLFSEHYGITWNGTLLVNVPLGVVTVTYPVIAPAGTVALMNVSETTVKRPKFR
jgi:hypothetical protein